MMVARLGASRDCWPPKSQTAVPGMQILIALPWKYHSRRHATVPSCNGWEVSPHRLPAGVSRLDGLRKRQGERDLSPRGPTGCPRARRPALRPRTTIVAEIRRLKPTKATMPKRWNTLRISAWGVWVGLLYGVVDQV